MRRKLSITAVAAASVITGGLFVGCEKEDSSAKTSSSSPYSTPATTPPSTTPAVGSMKDAAETATNAADAVTKPAGDSAVTLPALPTDAPPTAADADSTGKAQELLTQATQYIKENKLDLAEKAIAQLDALKPKLPAAYQPKIDQIHTALDAMKKGDGLKESLKNGLLGK